ncbi:enoyl-CoA hydratase-related protein [uncultured Williamsia sp.]|uniref:enoyl-CoA hydratase-related protein n=1 Tax=uncultured Williamsia sp. TaxID=259311 RepID=UPI002617698D|nr:enoyl-CoA hydratase-related protein [uncultured Williamsia sp.]
MNHLTGDGAVADGAPAVLAQALYGALAAGDREVLDHVLHADFSGRATEGLPVGLGGEHPDPRAMRRDFWGRIAKHYTAAAHPTEMVALDDGRLLVRGRYTGTARVSGRALDAEFVHVLTFADGAISRLEQLTDSHLWCSALGADDRGRTLTTIDFSVEYGVATIRLDRPDHRNAIDLTLAEDLLEAARRCAADRSVRAVLIEGAGTDLTVGGDIAYFGGDSSDELGAVLRRMTGPFHEAFAILASLDAPVVTAAHGSVAGGGLGFVYAADIVLAAPDTRFVTAFAAIGLSGDGGGTWHLPRLVGARRAAKMYLENYPLGAAEALEWGLITEIVPASDLSRIARERARALASGPTRAFAQMRILLHASSTSTHTEQLHAEVEGIVRVASTHDASEALTAFVQKRRPTFEGR